MRNAIAYCLALGAVVLLGQSAQAQLLEKKALTLAAARKMVAAAEAEAQRNNWCGVVAVVDDGYAAALRDEFINRHNFVGSADAHNGTTKQKTPAGGGGGFLGERSTLWGDFDRLAYDNTGRSDVPSRDHVAAIGSIKLGSLFFTLSTRALTGHASMLSEGRKRLEPVRFQVPI
jgi:hypothetical protein